MKCKDCKEDGCPFRCYTENGECSYVDFNEDSFDWQAFRNQAAKDILYAILSGGTASGATGLMEEKENIVKASIEIADELIRQLKEKEEK